MTSGPRRKPAPSKRRPRAGRTVVPARPPVTTARIVLVAGVLLAVVAALVFRVVDLQATPDPRVLDQVRIPLGRITVSAPRGAVIDRHGRTIALSLPAATVIANPRAIEDPEAAAAALSEALGVPADELLDALVGDSAFRYVARQLDPEVGERVVELDLAGVDVIEESRRAYPNGDCSGLGVVGRVNIDHVGMSGIEEAYNDRLASDSGQIVKEIGTGGATIPGGSHLVIDAVPGRDVQVTLDRNVQHQTEQILAAAVARAGAARAVGLVAIPSTGEIVAMANVARNADGIVACTRENLAVTWSFEPGSVLKPVTVAGALGTGLVTEHTPMLIKPSIHIWDHTFTDDPWHDPVEWTPTDIITRSSNVGAINLAILQGEEQMHANLIDFGLGTRTELGFKGEANGIVLPLKRWNLLTPPNVAIGQGVAVTPLQMLQIYNVIANDGYLAPPRLVVDPNDVIEKSRVIDSSVAAAVRRMLASVVESGTGRAAAIDGYVMAGKTGTAWQPCDVGYDCLDQWGHPDGRHYTASFAAIVSNGQGPALTILAVIDEPTGERISGGKVSAPVVAEIAEYAVRQLRIPAFSATGSGRLRRAQAASVAVPEVPDPPSAEEASETDG